MKKLSILLMVALLMMFIPHEPVYAAQTIEELVEEANQEILAIYGVSGYYDASKVNVGTYTKYEVFAYGSPHGDQDSKGEYRYLGYTPTGESFPNYSMDPDSSSGVPFNNLNWIADPWNSFKVLSRYSIEENDFDAYRADVLDHFIGAMERDNNNRYISENDTTPWDKYYHVIAPPTKNTHGSVWLWHTESNGSLWYITSVLLPTKYVHPVIDNVKVEYQDITGNTLLPGEMDTPGTTGSKTYYYKLIDGYDCINEAQIVNVQMNSTTHTITFLYKVIDEATPEPPIEEPVEPEKPIEEPEKPPYVPYVKTHELVLHVYPYDPRFPNNERNRYKTVINGYDVDVHEGYEDFSSMIGTVSSTCIYQSIPIGSTPPRNLIANYVPVPYSQLIGGQYSNYLSEQTQQPTSTISFLYTYKRSDAFSAYYETPSVELLQEFYSNGMPLTTITNLVKQYKNNYLIFPNEDAGYRNGTEYYEMQIKVTYSDEALNKVNKAILDGLE